MYVKPRAESQDSKKNLKWFKNEYYESVAWPCHYGLVNFYDPVYPAEEFWFAPETCSPAYSRTFDQTCLSSSAQYQCTLLKFQFAFRFHTVNCQHGFFIVDSVLAYRVLFPRSHLVNIVMIILFHIEPCFLAYLG